LGGYEKQRGGEKNKKDEQPLNEDLEKEEKPKVNSCGVVLEL